jgi:hypothetical protein
MKKITNTLKKDEENNIRNSVAVSICVISFVLLIMLITSYINLNTEPAISDTIIKNKELVYLSDIPYNKEQSTVGWGSITIDKNVNGDGLISLIVNGQKKQFIKGIGAHATSNVIFDLSEYDYDYFSTYYGVDAGRGTLSDGVKFAIYTSVDGITWDLHTPVSPPIKKGNTEAEFIEIDIKGKKYLKLHCAQYGSAGSDHCVYGGIKMYKESYKENGGTKVDFIKTIEEYDNELKNLTLENQLQNKELTLLQRELVKRVGYDMLQELASLGSEYEDTIRWLMTDINNLKLYIMGGYPAGNYINSLKELTRLHTNYKNDFNIETITKYGNKKGDIYKKMAISLSLTHSAKVALWMQPSEPSNQSDSVERYALFKKLYDENKFKVNDSIDITEWFESYKIEEMRFVMNNIIDDESILWLNDYTQKQIEAHPNQAWTYLTPHPYMAYVWPNYGNEVFHDPNRKTYWDNLFGGVFSKYGVTYTSGTNKVYKVWMNFRNEFGTGAVCGGISKTGSNIRTVHGIPAAVIGQPGHAAIIYYTRNSSGQGYWGIDNDVSGWTKSEKGERMLLGWGNDRTYAKGYNIPYMVMAQEAINRFDKYQKSAEITMLANIYENDKRKKEEYLWAALEELDFNVDTWNEIIKLYNSDDTKTEEDYFNLINKMSKSLLEYPTAYYNFMELIKPHFTSNQYKFNYSLLLNDTLTKAKNYKETDVLQPSVTRTLANYFLGVSDTTLATFSFSGDDAGKIVLSNKFDGSGVRWDYSLDGKTTWNEVSFTGNEEHKYQLTKEEINKITADNDIYIHIVGAPYNDENILKIDILENIITENAFFRNDLENRILGINLTYEWRNKETDEWTSYSVASPDNRGDKILQIRQAPNGTKLASNVLTFNFTEDNQSDHRKYIPVSHLSIHDVSTEAVNNGGSAIYAIDGNYNTRWHSAWNGTDTERYITIKLDKPVVLTAVEFVPAGGGNGKIYDGTIWGSSDGENWEILARETNLRYTNQANTNEDAIKNTKAFEIEEPKQVQYVKIVADRTNGNWFAARAFNFYEDVTKNPNPTASIGFDITKPTNKNVVARLINPSTQIKITNNNGSDTYTFTENGEFTFEFIDESNGMTGSATAKVTWIDKTPPTGTIRYNITSKTNKEVEALLVPSEDVIVLNNGDYESDNPNSDPMTHLFMENGSFTFEFKDKAGNIGTATATVDWIDTVIPNGIINYDITELTNKDVTATISLDKPDAKVTNNNGKNHHIFTDNGNFTFIFSDEAGNTNRETAYVNWIDKVAPNAWIEYSTTKKTKKPVIATIKSDEKITITNNDGKDTYTFTENGEFDFTYVDMLGNKGKIKAKVTWIETDKPTTDKPTTDKPANPDNNNPGTSKPEDKPDNDENNKPDKEETKTYETFTYENITMKVETKYIPEKVSLKKTRFTIDQSLEKRFGLESDYIELYLTNDAFEKVNISADKITLTFELAPEKEFKGIYEIVNGKPKEIKYKKNKNGTIEIETKNLNKYIIHYGEIEKITKTENKKQNHTVAWIIVGCFIALTGAGAYITKKDKKNKIKE